MKAALFSDIQFVEREDPVIRRLVVGLVGEMVQTLQVMPYDEKARSGDVLTGKVLEYQHSVFRFVRDYRLNRMLEEIEAEQPDVLHALDVMVYPSVVKLASKLNLPVACSVWSEADIDALRVTPGVPKAFFAPTQPLYERLRMAVPQSSPVHLTRPGVYLGAEDLEPPLQNPLEALCILVVGDGKGDDYYHTMLEGFARVRQHLPQVMFFIYALQGQAQEFWGMASKLNLLSHITMTQADREIRDLLVQADVLIQPQPYPVVRTLVLDGMGASRPVVAAEAPALDYLVDGESAMLLSHATADEWSQLFVDLASDAEPFIRLGESARGFIQENHSAAAYVESVIEGYKKVATPEPIPFKG